MLGDHLHWIVIAGLVAAVAALGYVQWETIGQLNALYDKLPASDLPIKISDASIRAGESERLSLENKDRVEALYSAVDMASSKAEKHELRLAQLELGLEALKAEQVKVIEYEIKPEELRKLVADEVRLNDEHFREVILEEMAKYEIECRKHAHESIKKIRTPVQAVKEIEEPAGALSK